MLLGDQFGVIHLGHAKVLGIIELFAELERGCRGDCSNMLQWLYQCRDGGCERRHDGGGGYRSSLPISHVNVIINKRK